MTILILAAMDKEIDLLINLLVNPEKIEMNDIRAWRGEIAGHDIIVTKCGIGKVNSAINTYKCIKNFNPGLVINSGVAGGAGIPVGTVLVADKVAYHDVWCGPGTNYGQADSFPLFMNPSPLIIHLASIKNFTQGLVCSGDKFISTPEEIVFIKNKFPDVKAVDMESASIAQTCIMCDVPFAVIRVVSDTPGEGENISQYKDFWNTAPHKTFEVVSEILAQI